MASRAGETGGAVSIFMDMQGVEVGGAGNSLIGEPEKFPFDQNTAVRRIIKTHHTA